MTEEQTPDQLIDDLRKEFRAELDKLTESHNAELKQRDETIAKLSEQTETLKAQLVRETVQSPPQQEPEQSPEEREKAEYAAVLEERSKTTIEILKNIG